MAISPTDETGKRFSLTHSIKLPLWAFLLCLVGVGIAAYVLSGSDLLRISVLDKTFTLELERGKGDIQELLVPIYSDERTKQMLMDWLREKEIYHLYDERIAEKLSAMLPEIDEDNLLIRHQQYSIMIENNRLIQRLREKARTYKPPFQHIGEKVKVGVPGNTEHHPPQYQINVPMNSQLVGKRIKIYNPNTDLFLVLEGRAAFEKTEAVDVQLNSGQARYLFSRIAGKTTEGIIYVLPSTEGLYDPINPSKDD